jgi:uncharacterized RDD family membrane protein YckC
MPLSDRLRIDTPEQVALEFATAGLGSRFLAMAVDTLLQVALGGVALVVLLVLATPAGLFAWANSVRSVVPAIAVLVLFALNWGYFAAFEIWWQGQTPGKRLARIRVIKDSGRALDLSSAIIRNLLRAVDGLPAMYGVGVVCMLINRDSRRLGDLAAGTLVVHEATTRTVAAWMSEPPAAPVPAPTLGGARLSVAELTVIETFLARRLDLDMVTQLSTESDIVARLTARTGLAPAPGQARVDFLEQMAREARDAGRLG